MKLVDLHGNLFRMRLLGSWLLLLWPASTLFAVDLPVRWRWSNPQPHGANVVDSAYKFGLTLHVAERGQIFTSEDLFFWEPRNSGTTSALRAVTFFEDRLVITGEGGTVVYGDSLEDLRAISLGTTDWLEGVAASSNLILAVGDNAAIYTSTNGNDWQRQIAPFGDWLRGVAYSPVGDGFVTVGESGLIATSNNGINWIRRTSNTTRNLNRVFWISDRFWVVGDGGILLESSSGVTWTPVNSGATNILYAAAGSVDTRLLAGDKELRFRASATNNINWSDELDFANPSLAPRWTYRTALWEGDTASNTGSYLIAGRTGMIVEGFLTNSGPIPWINLDNSVRNWLWDVTRVSGLYVAVGDRANVLTSANGIDWSLELVPDAVTNAIFLGVGGTTNALLAVGNKGSMILSPNVPVTVVSTNADGTYTTNQASGLGVIWNAVVPRPTTNDVQGVTVFGGQFVVTGGAGTILVSGDGTNWTRRPAPTAAFLSSVESYPDGLVAVGDEGTILTSPDASTWTVRASNTTNWIYRVRYLQGQLIAVGENGTILTSADGANWTAQVSNTRLWLSDVEWVGDTYFVAGTQGTMLASTNAVNWTNIGTITLKSLYGLATGNGQLVAVGVEGVIVRSQIVPNLEPIRFLSFSHDVDFSVFLVAGQQGQRFTLDRIAGFVSQAVDHWISGPVLEFLDSSGTLLYLESNPTNTPPRQFYRGALVQP